ncbi:hypothetical protein HHK36_029342 [Tetracentron sinense]|uniref:Uncharacterized protein n=1 Tax=Tetracentron sinense TaxID=13715 RepID=A0A834YEN4_TETSI|nr:hypothetical protein HHK36_029342 [Tetracentron sinense]
MGLLKLLLLFVCLVFGLLLHSAESMVFIHFDRAPSARSKLSTAVFRYTVLGLDGSNACKKHNGCSFNCELDGQTVRPCPVDLIVLKNLTVNHSHYFLLNVTTGDGERNSSAYKWFIDTIPPTASIVSEKNYTNAERIAIDVIFSEACTGRGGFKCLNSSSCDVMVTGPAYVDASSLRTVEPDIKYSLVIALSWRSIYGRIVIKMADNFCTDQAGNQFTRTNESVIIVHFDRRPVQADFWTSVPSYEFELNRVPRTVLATNKMEDLEIFLDLRDPVVNSTEDILNALNANLGNFIPIHGKNHGNRRFVFGLRNVSRTEIITVKLQSAFLIGRSGTPVSPVTPITFLYDSTKPGVVLSTDSPGVTKETNINVIVEFTEPVFGFEASSIEVGSGRLSRQVHMVKLKTTASIILLIINLFKELSKALYSLTVVAVSQNVVSIIVPEGKANDVAGNLNMASNRLEVKHYSPPAISVALHSFVTAGILTTSLAAAVLSLSCANLGAIGASTSGTTNVIVSAPSMNLAGMVGHLQVFVLSDWLLVGPPVDYSETTRGLRWLIPREKLPWNKDSTSIWPKYESPSEGPNKLSMKYRGLSMGSTLYEIRSRHSIESNSHNISYLQHGFPMPTELLSKVGGLNGKQNVSMKNTPYGQDLDASEYFVYFLRGEPLSAVNVIKAMKNYTGVVDDKENQTMWLCSLNRWKDLEMNLFWLGVGGGSLLMTHLLILLFLRWRTGTSVPGILSVPRFELFLLILMLPCISQSSAFVIRGGTTEGIIAGTLLLAIPAALTLSVCLFLTIAIFVGGFVQYKEVKDTSTREPWYTMLSVFFAGKPTTGKWFYWKGLPSSFLPRFGFLFEDRKGPPVFVLVDHNDPNSLPKWVDSGQSGIGRMRAMGSDDSNEETKVPMSKRLLGCARSSYIILDLLRRVSLGIISGAYSSRRPNQTTVALAITLIQFLYLFTLKPYIRRRVHVVESVSLLCEAGIFGLSVSVDYSNPVKERTMGFVMLALLFISFVSQLVNEWYALIKCLIRLSRPQEPSFKLGLKCVAKGLVLPFLPRKHWSRLVTGSSQPRTGLVQVLPLSPETELERRGIGVSRGDTLSAMTATIVPVRSPNSPGLADFRGTGPTTAQTSLSEHRAGEGKQRKGYKLEPKSELKKLRELAKASFSGGSNCEEASSSYAPREHCDSDGVPYS